MYINDCEFIVDRWHGMLTKTTFKTIVVLNLQKFKADFHCCSEIRIHITTRHFGERLMFGEVIKRR